MLLQALVSILRWREQRYQQSGNHKNAQLMRKQQHLLIGLSEEDILTFKKFLDEEYWLRLVVQKEAHYFEKLQKLQEEVRLEMDVKTKQIMTQRCDILEKGLEWASQNYFNASQRIHYFDCSTFDKPLNRAIKCLRENPKWYLSDFLRWDCAGRGGCCGRLCGCCERSRSTVRSSDLGHCTIACECCTTYQGFELEIKPGGEKVASINVMARDNDSFSGRMMDAYVWGLRTMQ
ncbi:uncharacterized protein LDX57_010681 [Aspergillus melleus]|uniref:uncharacterized protein n=1 Tax=Aspergillus melleus TaxID=138277 RepID=UPI001E8CED89|nr:uncharacterized protein LDX57_010681 [Aspergillus melleus]KAH8433042.1 hypothetical protein LDX57_010681 [Aspergillus melleus]